MNTDELDRIRQRLGTTSYSPWKDDTFALLHEVERLRADVQSYRALADDYAEEFEAVCAERDVRRARQRHVRAERDRLAATLDRVREVHEPRHIIGHHYKCDACGVAHPCPTIAAIEGADS